MIKDKTIQMTNLHTMGRGSQNLASYLSQYRIFRRQFEIFMISFCLFLYTNFRGLYV